LNENFVCEICDANICSKCYVKVDLEKEYLTKNDYDLQEDEEEEEKKEEKENKEDKKEDFMIDTNGVKKRKHKCEKEAKISFRAIKKEAKPCPTCGEFISKISGCDQMFCIKCGTGFSWTSGQIEKGVIHNPHAHDFFRNNPDMLNGYLNNRNQNENGCRDHVPNGFIINHKFQHKINSETISNTVYLIRKLAEFRDYNRTKYVSYLNNDNPDIEMSLESLRERFINNQIDEKTMKQHLHRIDKKNFYLKQVSHVIICAYEIFEIMVWNIVDIFNSEELLEENKELVDYCKRLNLSLENVSQKDVYLLYNNCKLFDKYFKYLDDKVKKKLDAIETLRKESNETLCNIAQMFGYIESHRISSKYMIYKEKVSMSGAFSENKNTIN